LRGDARLMVWDEAARAPQSARQRAILSLVRERGFVSVAQIVARFGVSEMTVRRDLRALEETRWLQRTHGGAISTADEAGGLGEPPFTRRQRLHEVAKRAIAVTAAGLVRPGDTIGLDVGTTTLELARRLLDAPKLTVFTNSLRAAMVLASGPVAVYTPGGRVRAKEMSLGGSIALAQLERYRLDRVFLGVSGLTTDGIFDYSLEDTEIKRLYIRQATEVVVLADASKFEQWSVVKVAELAEIDRLVTDRQPPESLNAALAAARVDVMVVEADERGPS
jgi:DeoR family glycerol-3-phosphate regulon repressor